VGTESQGSSQEPVPADLAKFLSEEDSRAAECDIVKVTKGAGRLFYA
jgi:hypothetical protein